MDEGTRWSPAPALVFLAWLLAAAAATLGVLAPDPPGRLIAATATALLILAALYGVRARPRLAADTTGIVVRGLRRPARYQWPEVDRLRVMRTRRWGREAALLEIDVHTPDGSERLLLFGRLDLGADPDDVAAVLDTLRAGQPPG